MANPVSQYGKYAFQTHVPPPKRGRPRDGSAFDAGYTGYLVLEERTHRNRFSSLDWRARRPGLKAKGGPRDIVPPLYNSCPVNMLDMPDPQITLQGYERHVKGAT